MNEDEAYAVVRENWPSEFGYMDVEPGEDPSTADLYDYAQELSGHELDPDLPDDEVDELTLAVRVLSRPDPTPPWRRRRLR